MIYGLIGLNLLLIITCFWLLSLLPKKSQKKESFHKITLPEKQALRTMSLGLAHELKNPVTSIKMLLELNQNSTSLTNQPQLREILLFEVERLDKLITEFLYFADPGQFEWATTNLNAIIGTVIDKVKHLFPNHALTFQLNVPDLPSLTLDKKKLTQALLNLLINSVEAMPQKTGDIQFKTQLKNEFLTLLIIDSGHGILSSDTDKISLPFFTTKQQGPGLGLPIAERIIGAHGGTLSFSSKDGGPTTFKIMLPLQFSPASLEKAPESDYSISV